MTPEIPVVSVLRLGFLLRAKLSLDADHIVAISTIATEQRGLGRACAIGFCWGIGHTLVLLLAGLAVLGFKLTISDEWARLLEAAVGLMLVGLGLSVGLTLWRERLHVHPHAHADGAAHLHVHSHRDGPHHAHLHRYRLEYRSLAVGMVHGLAGSAALLLLVLSTARSVLDGVLYILAFGAGAIAAMVLLGIMMMLPFVFTPARLVGPHLALRALAGLASVSLGGIILYESVVL